jgi:hypothetical protein
LITKNRSFGSSWPAFLTTKLHIKKTSQNSWNVLGKNWERLGTFGKILGKAIFRFPQIVWLFLVLELRYSIHKRASFHLQQVYMTPNCLHQYLQISDKHEKALPQEA